MEGHALKGVVTKLGEASSTPARIATACWCRSRRARSFVFAQTLQAEIDRAIDKGLWHSMRAVEERVMLLHQLQDLPLAAGSNAPAAQFRAQADASEKRLQPLRDLVLDPTFFGHAVKG